MSKVLMKKRVGLVLRAFATKPEDVSNRVDSVVKLIELAESMRIGDKQVFSRIDVLIWADPRYADADCGATEAAFKEYQFPGGALFGQIKPVPLCISTVEHGDLFCGVLNHGIARQLRDRIDYTLVMSSEAQSYFDIETVAALLEAVDQGAKAAGVAINELTESVLDGRLANTMCLWDNVALVSVGGFDLRAAKPVNDKSARYLKGADEKGKPVFYALAGVEEVIPLARLVEAYGPCLAPILPQGSGAKHYEVPNPVTQADLYARHVAKMGTKLERQTALLASAGFDLSHLRGGVMQAYQQQK